MTIARSHLVLPDTEGYYHCIQRCVRRAFLCGEDQYAGRSFEHRKTWIEDRLRLLGECFAVAIHAYAIMSNHLHVVVQISPAAVSAWSDDDVATRWVRLFPPATDDAIQLKRQRILTDPTRLSVVRSRLGNLSWFMRCLAEPIARRANREDDCKGRFWEGRYKCQLLCNERALLAAMTYVDLNPIRAGITDRLETSTHTGAHDRLTTARASPDVLAAPLRAIIGMKHSALPLSTADYLQILDWTGRTLAPNKRGSLAGNAPTILTIIDDAPERWTMRVRGFGSAWARAVGSMQDMIAIAERIGQRWIKGIRLAARLG